MHIYRFHVSMIVALAQPVRVEMILDTFCAILCLSSSCHTILDPSATCILFGALIALYICLNCYMYMHVIVRFNVTIN